MSHGNAALTLRARLRLARLIVDDRWPVVVAAKMFVVSPVTARKWAGRYRLEGPVGMADRSSRPRSMPTRAPSNVVKRIVRARWRRWLGPVQIAGELGMAASTVHDSSTRLADERGRHGISPILTRHEKHRGGREHEQCHVDSSAIAERHGFTANGGPRVHQANEVYDGTVAEHFNEYDKRDRALRLAQTRAVAPGQCCAIGDSRSDIPLFNALPFSLALNAGQAARTAATAAIDTQDLQDILPWLEDWARALD